MSVTTIVLLMGAVGTLLTAASGVYWAARRNSAEVKKEKIVRNSTDAAILLGGWEAFAAKAAAMYESRIADMKAEFAEERAEWERRELALQKRIDTLEARVMILMEEKRGGHGA